MDEVYEAGDGAAIKTSRTIIGQPLVVGRMEEAERLGVVAALKCRLDRNERCWHWTLIAVNDSRASH
jgi:hypothetical protein